MNEKAFDAGSETAWCPGCGNFGILNLLKKALSELDLAPEQVVLVSGIGQAAKTPHYLRANFFNGLHGRALPPATGIKVSNPGLTVIAESGDGDMYGEGGNHFMHTIRRNPNITNIVHNNMVYGLTKGQASPTTSKGFKTSVQVGGVIAEPFNPMAVAIALNASFVARAFVGNAEHTKEILKKAILHKGYALIDIFQPCVTFNKTNTYAWFRENTYIMDDSHNPHDRNAAMSKAFETEKLPLGVFYVNEKTTFEESTGMYAESADPLWKREPRLGKLRDLIGQMRRF